MVSLKHHYWIYQKTFRKKRKTNPDGEDWTATYWVLMKTREGKPYQHEFLKMLGNVETVDQEEAIARAYERCPELSEGPEGVPIEVEFVEMSGCPAADGGAGHCPYWVAEKQWCNWTGEKVMAPRACMKWRWIKEGVEECFL